MAVETGDGQGCVSRIILLILVHYRTVLSWVSSNIINHDDTFPPMNLSSLPPRTSFYWNISSVRIFGAMYAHRSISGRIVPICACAMYNFFTQLANALARCYFALAQCYSQRSSALLQTRLYSFANGPIRTPCLGY